VFDVEVEDDDWVGIFKGDTCVGSRKWDTSLCGGGICDLPAMGWCDYINDNNCGYPPAPLDEYLLPGDIPIFKIYDASEDMYYDATPSEEYAWVNSGFFILDLLSVYTSVFGCTGESSCNYNPDATVDEGSCIYPDDHHDCYGNCLVELDCAGNCCVLGEEGCYWQETGPCGEAGPNNGTDSCGVCGGDNTSCSDCAGVPCSDAYVDNCGVCDEDSSNDCIQDCLGEWGGAAVFDDCGICDGPGAVYDCGCYDSGDDGLCVALKIS
jgi:hypothetical protein